ncbi:hypothetical protein [Streptomyces sp. NPDC001388]|uniref:hypothetical protein n=1 Tax=unclassified Streptomyces TaxID=2593676 RepID=UPI00367B2741
MLWVALLLLPSLSVLLAVLDRVEDRMLAPVAAGPRHAARRRHLRLIKGTSPDRTDAGPLPEPAEPAPAPEGPAATPDRAPRARAA